MVDVYVTLKDSEINGIDSIKLMTTVKLPRKEFEKPESRENM